MASTSIQQPLLSTSSPSILEEDVAGEDGDRRSSSSSFASISSIPPVNQAGVAIVLEGKTFEKMHRAFFWLMSGVFISLFLTLLVLSAIFRFETEFFVAFFCLCCGAFPLLSIDIIQKMSTLRSFYRGDVTPPKERPIWLFWGGIITATMHTALLLLGWFFLVGYLHFYFICCFIPFFIEVFLLLLSPLFRHPPFISFVARWKIVFGVLLFPLSFGSFFLLQGVHFLCSLAILIFISIAKMFGFLSDPHLFASFRGAAALSLCYLHLFSFPFFKIPDLLSSRYQRPPSVVAVYLKIGIFVIFCLIMPAVDVITDVVYLASFLPVGFDCFQAIDQTFYEQQAAELYNWKVLAVVSCVFGWVVMVVHYVGYFFRFRGKEGWLPLRATLVEASDELSGDTFDLQKSVIVSTTAKFVGSVGEDLLSLLVACGSLGFIGSYSISWILTVASSALSIAFYWSVLASKFVYGKYFSGKVGIWIQANLVLFLAGMLVTIPSVTQTSEHFNYQYRPHELYSNRTEVELWNCGRLRLCCFALPFNVNDIQWVTANCDLTIQHETIRGMEFPNLEQIRSVVVISHNSLLKEIQFPVLQDSECCSSGLGITNNSVLTFLGFPMLESAYILGVTSNPKLQEVDLPALQYSSNLEIAHNSVLSSLGFPMLESANSLDVIGNPMLQVVNFPVLQGFSSSSSRLEIGNNPLLTSLEFPKLEMAGVVFVANNAALTSLVCDKLDSLVSATISNNPALHVVHFPSLLSSYASSIIGFEGTVVFSDRNVTYPLT